MFILLFRCLTTWVAEFWTMRGRGSTPPSLPTDRRAAEKVGPFLGMALIKVNTLYFYSSLKRLTSYWPNIGKLQCILACHWWFILFISLWLVIVWRQIVIGTINSFNLLALMLSTSYVINILTGLKSFFWILNYAHFFHTHFKFKVSVTFYLLSFTLPAVSKLFNKKNNLQKSYLFIIVSFFI